MYIGECSVGPYRPGLDKCAVTRMVQIGVGHVAVAAVRRGTTMRTSSSVPPVHFIPSTPLCCLKPSTVQ
ncbi:uncharacterized protein MYCGRDRAFT_105966 [Zymoseptoria tritici IPO323]|uniref:Uncharacterized protein n=1 Tax=Zymoseptoria tritici (strain CBS 115943 / IPO323) TaxID=336722 RepID=F9XL68_ZYMTI|nr:uncharacterized protein MYCGRDRAFT_105966 [Zymoseptoria tritici IPO323]EGP84087.1 hypothetical protein MYCGRDRAFT_105966 [Zymoseptoria tritici IPO323]